MSHPVFEDSFRSWIADRIKDFSAALKNGDDPEVTFDVTLKNQPAITMQIRLMEIDGVFTRNSIPIGTGNK